MFKEFLTELKALAIEHYKLFKQELSENVHDAIKVIVLFLSALLIAYVGLTFLGLLAVFLLVAVMPLWAAFLLVTAVYFAIPIVLVICAMKLYDKIVNKPKKSIEELEKTGEEAKKWLNNLKN